MDVRTINRAAYELGGDTDKARQIVVMVEHITALENLQKEVNQLREDLNAVLWRIQQTLQERL